MAYLLNQAGDIGEAGTPPPEPPRAYRQETGRFTEDAESEGPAIFWERKAEMVPGRTCIRSSKVRPVLGFQDSQAIVLLCVCQRAVGSGKVS